MDKYYDLVIFYGWKFAPVVCHGYIQQSFSYSMGAWFYIVLTYDKSMIVLYLKFERPFEILESHC